MKKQLLIGLLVGLILGLVGYSYYLSTKIGKIPVEAKIEQGKTTCISQPVPPQLVPARPEDYGIVMVDEHSKPVSQSGWDNLMLSKVQEAKSQMPQEIREKIKESPAKTKEKIAHIDESIKKCQEALKKEPDNQELKDKMQNLMMLKTVAKGLSEN